MRSKTLLIILLCFCYVYGKSIHRRTFTRRNVTSPAEGGGDATKKKKSVSYRPSHLDNGQPTSDTTFDTFEESPILWTAYHHNNAVGSRKSVRKHNKNKAKCGKGDACSRSGWEEVDEDSMPSTANPNPNIFGGFPENDVWGNFELPPPAELEKLKEHLKQPANRKIPNYGDEQEPDEIGQMYNYENHALPEYDIMDTPSLQELMAQHIKQKASCSEAACTNKLPTQSTCDHFNALCAVNAKHPKGGAPEYEGPCASKILEMFGCKPKSSVEAAEPAAAAKTNNAVKLVTSPLKLVASPVKAGNKTAKSVKLKDFDKTVEASIKSTEKELNKVIQSMNLLKPQQQPEAQPSLAPLKHKKLKSQDGNKRLIKEDDSLALMAALGNDLQKNFAKLQFSDKTNNTNQQTNTTQLDNKNTTLGHGTTDKSDDKTTTEDADAALTEEIDNRMYSDWSAWSKCSHHCFRSTKARRRNCLHDQCNGVLEEKVACVNPTCAKFSEIKRLAGIRANETAKKLSVDLLHLKGSQVFNDVIKAGEAFTLASKQIQQQENISTAIPKDPFKMFANYATVQISNEEKEGKTAVKTSEKNTTELKTAAASEATPSSAADLAASKLLENLFNTSVADDTAKISPKEAPEPVTPGNLVPPANATTEGSIEKSTEEKNPEDVIVDKLISHFTQRILDDSVRSATNGLNEDIKAEAAASKGGDTEETAENDDESTTIANLLSQKLANTSMGLLEGEKSDPVWGEWSSCSITCGQGHATRNLICAANQCNDIILHTQLKPCNMGSCQDNKKDDLQGSCLSLHNEYRRRHGAATLEWSDELYRKATEIANRISINNIPGQNLSIYERPGLNLAYMSLGDVAPQTSACSRAVDKWYLQKMFYNYDAPKLTPEDHDFTQLVWKSSRRVGLARMNSLGNDAVYVAAVYEPAGNVDQETEMRKNVMAVPTGPDVDILKDLFSSAKKSKVLSAKKYKLITKS